MASYYRRFITLQSPFIGCQTAFLQLRKQLSSAPILAHPDFSQQFILDTDGSESGLGGVLSKVGEDGKERVIAYGSQLLTKPERCYCVTRRELLAIVKFTRQYCYFEVVNRRGMKHINADALSRLPCNQCGQLSHESQIK
jgi:hypothetical protein